jgi:L-ribulose-5-phosphate 3-epimerase UlaE
LKPIESDYLLGLYEKALPSSFPWEKRLETAKKLGYSFVEISIDETDERLLRVQWPRHSRMEMRSAIANTEVPILTMCLSGNRRFPIGSENKETREKGIQLIKDAVDFSVDIGNRIVQLAGYDNYYEERNQNTEEYFLDGLNEVTDYAADNAVMLAIENVDTDFMNTIPKIMRYIEKVAYTWEREEIKTLDAAEQYLKQLEMKRSLTGEVKRVLQIKDRELAAGERKYVENWISMGFAPEAIEIAYDKTVLKTGRLAWSYMDSILTSWHQKGLHASDEILQKDGKGTSTQKTAPKKQVKTAADDLADYERMKKFLEKMRGE